MNFVISAFFCLAIAGGRLTVINFISSHGLIIAMTKKHNHFMQKSSAN